MDVVGVPSGVLLNTVDRSLGVLKSTGDVAVTVTGDLDTSSLKLVRTDIHNLNQHLRFAIFRLYCGLLPLWGRNPAFYSERCTIGAWNTQAGGVTSNLGLLVLSRLISTIGGCFTFLVWHVY
jgi:hypothetical protein